MKKYWGGLIFLFVFSYDAYSQTVEYSMGLDRIVFTLTPCTKTKAINTIEFFMESKSFYYFDIYQFDFTDVLRGVKIISGDMSDLIKIYNGYSYGTINFGYYRINCIMYSNADTGQYSLLQFADFN
ncbi:MAG: hypothetical protein LBO67_04595 [Spirochaetaceae bacterium]|nr:hypothetical protein [Spirochaetaceae bacterium]